MNPLADSFAAWLADYYLLSAVLLALAIGAAVCLRQPVQRLTVAKSVIAALFLLAAMCALPGWSVVHLLTEAPRSAPEPAVADAEPVTEPNRTEYSVLSTKTMERAEVDSMPVRPTSDAVVVAAPRRNQYSWTAILFIVYATGAACVIAWLALGSLAAGRLRRKSMPAPPELSAMLADILGASAVRKPRVELRTSDHIDIPVALGIRRPMILLPTRWALEFPLPCREGQGEGSFFDAASTADLRTILAHEAAHIRNQDLHWLAASRVLLVVLWAQPLYWLLRRRMRLEQETLADAAAVEVTSRERYAEQLVTWARTAAARPALQLSSAVGLWEGPSQLRRRIAVLLNEQFTVLRACPRYWRLAAIGVATSLALALSTITLQPSTRAEEASAGRQPGASEHGANSVNEKEPKHFVRLVAGPSNELTFEGEYTTWDELKALLDRVPDRGDTVLEFAVSDPENMSVRDMEQSRSKAMASAHSNGFLYGSYVGVHPLGSKGTSDSPGDEAAQESGESSAEKKGAADDKPSSVPAGVQVEKRINLPIIAAQHVLLLNGNQITTWDEIEAKIAALPDPSLAYPHLYVTNGAREAGTSDAANERVNELHRKFKLQGHSLGSLSPRTDVRYDRIKTEADLKPDEKLRMEGTVTDQQGKPIAGAEVVLITPVDESISYKTVDIVLVEGRLRNRLDEVVTDTDAQGRFVLYPPPAGGPEGPHYYVVAMHPEFGMVVSPGLTDLEMKNKNRLSLVSWGGLVATLEPEEGSKQSVSLRSHVREQEAKFIDQNGGEQIVRGGYPEVVFTQYWSDLNRQEKDNTFQFNRVPPMADTSISRDVSQADGGSIGVTAASVSLLSGESRQLDLGPLSDKQREMLDFERKESERRLEEFREGDGSGVMPAPIKVTPIVQSVADEKEKKSERPPAILSYGDGKPDGKKSYGGSGHLIEFTLPEGVDKVRGIRIHGSRYGLPQAPKEDFEITFLSEDGKETLHSETAPYHLFKRGKEQWVRVMFDKEVELPKKFWVSLNFNPHQTKGVYLSYDTSTKGEHSRVGLPGDEEEPKPTDFGGDWMVQLMLARRK